MTAILPEALQPLRSAAVWCVWKVEERDGKPTKVPYRSHLSKARSNDPTTWQAFDKLPHGNGFAGPGLMLGDGRQGIDLDMCIGVSGELEPWAAEIVDRLDSYTEVSPSGRGLKVYLRGPAGGQSSEVSFGEPVEIAPGTTKRREIALYTGKRFFAFTGDIYRNRSMREVSPEDIAWLREKIEATRRVESRRKTGGKRGNLRDFLGDDWDAELYPLPQGLQNLIREGVPEGQRSDQFHHTVCWLADQGKTAEQIGALLARYPNGIATKYDGRLEQEVVRCLKKRQERREEDKPHTDQGGDAQKYRLLSVAELLALPPTRWLVNDLLPARGLAVLYGEPGSGKSFLALDIVAHLARQQPWADRRVRRAKVVYVVLEGNLRNRLDAYRQHHGLTDADLVDLKLIQNQPLNLLIGSSVPGLIASLRAQLGEDAGDLVIVIDTLARAMPGGDENASKDMGALIAACGEIERHLTALVVLVHHSGKDAGRGARGWSGLKGAADAEIVCERDGNQRTATFAKVKDGADGVAFEFRLEVVDVGPRTAIDPDAEWHERITSCVAVVTGDAEPKAKQKALGKHQKTLLTALRNSGPWIRKQCEDFMQAAGIPRNRRKEVIDSLLLAGVIEDTVAGLRVKT